MGKQFVHNDGKHIHFVMTTTSCKKHSAVTGDPCYIVNSGTGSPATELLGVCGVRIKRAGFNGKISETSFQTRRPSGPRPDGRRRFSNKKKEAA
jgi:hypothetical protein